MPKLAARVTKFQKFMEATNIVDLLDDDELASIGKMVVDEYEIDEDSRSEWRKIMDESLKIAKQLPEAKGTPWANASNIKYPHIPIACMQFNSRMYGEIIKDNKVCKTMVFSPDPTGEIGAAANRIADHISYQLLEQLPNWERNVDKLLMTLPLFGHMFKKICYDPVNRRPSVIFCPPHEVVLNQSVSSLEDARRISHVMIMYNNEIIERMNAGIFKKIDMDEFSREDIDTSNYLFSQKKDAPKIDGKDSEIFQQIIEQHRYLDLDKDGYREPYIVTVHKKSRKVLRIKANYNPDSIIISKGGYFVGINAIPYFSDYTFLPSADGTYYGTGFGHLLYSSSQAVNTIYNQLIDAGTLSNMGGGFVDSRWRTKKGLFRFIPGEMKEMAVPMGMNVTQMFAPLPIREPSAVLFQLLGLLTQSMKDLSAVTDIMQGQQPATNTPATTVLALIEQGSKVYSSIQKRVYLGLKKELELLAYINKTYLDDVEYFKANQATGLVKREDYEMEGIVIYPIADPNISSQAMRMARAQALMQIIDRPEVDGREIVSEYLDAINVTNKDKVMPPPPPNPPVPPEIQKTMAETALIQMQASEIQFNKDKAAIKHWLDERQLSINATQIGAQAAQMHSSTIIQHQQIILDYLKLLHDEGAAKLNADLQVALKVMDQVGINAEKAAEAEQETPEQAEQVKAEVAAPLPGAERLGGGGASPEGAPDMGGAPEEGAPESAPVASAGGPPDTGASPLPQEDESMATTGNPSKPSPEGAEELIKSGAL